VNFDVEFAFGGLVTPQNAPEFSYLCNYCACTLRPKESIDGSLYGQGGAFASVGRLQAQQEGSN
jgi:hypothetical protein